MQDGNGNDEDSENISEERRPAHDVARLNIYVGDLSGYLTGAVNTIAPESAWALRAPQRLCYTL